MGLLSSIDDLHIKENGKVLLISESDEVITSIEDVITKLKLPLLKTSDTNLAINHLKSEFISFVLIDINLITSSSDQVIKTMREYIDDSFVPIIILASSNNELQLALCSEMGCDDFLFKPFSAIALNTRITLLKKVSHFNYLYKESVNEQVVANRILNAALEERCIKINDIGLLSKSASVFSGDLFLTSRHKDGSLSVLLADFTGHGLSAAIGALPVADAFSAMTGKGFGLEHILDNINRKLVTLLPANMFMACIILNISSDLKQVKIWNGGMPDVCIRPSGGGPFSHIIESSHVPLGIDKTLISQFKLETIDLSLGDELILYSDGLTDAMDKDGHMFGDDNVNALLQKSSNDLSIFNHVVEVFYEFCGDIKPIDDVTLACIPCISGLMDTNDAGASTT